MNMNEKYLFVLDHISIQNSTEISPPNIYVIHFFSKSNNVKEKTSVVMLLLQYLPCLYLLYHQPSEFYLP